MRRLGYYMHKTPSGKLLVKLATRKPPKLGVKVLNKKGKTVGIIVDIIGPIRSPYAILKPKGTEVELSEFEELFYR